MDSVISQIYIDMVRSMAYTVSRTDSACDPNA